METKIILPIRIRRLASLVAFLRILLATKVKEPVKGGDSKGKENTVKGGHSTSKSPSKKETHQKGEARRHQEQNVNPAFKEYRKHGGKLSKSAWLKQGQPKR